MCQYEKADVPIPVMKFRSLPQALQHPIITRIAMSIGSRKERMRCCTLAFVRLTVQDRFAAISSLRIKCRYSG